MDTGTCSDCRFWSEIQDGLGYCRRYAPRPQHHVTVMKGHDDPGNGYTKPGTEKVPKVVHYPDFRGWPDTFMDDWCGEWEQGAGD